MQIQVQVYNIQYDKKQGELFHVWVITKDTNVDTLFDSGSQVNLVFE